MPGPVTERRPLAKRSLAEAFVDTVNALRRARVHFGQGTSDATEEAGCLLSYVVRVAPEVLNFQRDRVLTPSEERKLNLVLTYRIKERLPAAYITREGWLRGFRFKISKHVIIPRSHIAFLLGDGLASWVSRRPSTVLDLCTGSGCLAVLAAMEYPLANIEAVDISRNATRLALQNVAAHGVADRVHVIQSDLYAGIARKVYDLIICNPPYVSARSMAMLPPEYLHEPRIALFGGDDDGLNLVRKILHSTRRHLSPRGVLICEVGNNRHRLESQFPRTPFVWLDTNSPGADVFLLPKDALPTAAD